MAFMGVMTPEQIAEDPQQQLRAWKPEKEYLVCIDTDGHCLDNMSAKQMLVFHPFYMDMNGLRGIEVFFRVHCEHHNLWSTTRGCDRYLAVQATLGSLLDDPQGKDMIDADLIRGLKQSIDGYIDWINATEGVSFGIPTLTQYHQDHGLDYNITRLLSWSEAVDRSFAFTTLKMKAFPGVRETVECLSERADILVVSGTPYNDLAEWWGSQDLLKYIKAIASKEVGKKNVHIGMAKEAGGYTDDNVIMGGDGGGDLKAAQENNALFFPTPAGKEVEAWADARGVFDAFFDGKYRGSDLEKQKLDEFDGALLKQGPWEEAGHDPEAAYKVNQELRVSLYKDYLPEGKLVVL